MQQSCDNSWNTNRLQNFLFVFKRVHAELCFTSSSNMPTHSIWYKPKGTIDFWIFCMSLKLSNFCVIDKRYNIGDNSWWSTTLIEPVVHPTSPLKLYIQVRNFPALDYDFNIQQHFLCLMRIWPFHNIRFQFRLKVNKRTDSEKQSTVVWITAFELSAFFQLLHKVHF